MHWAKVSWYILTCFSKGSITFNWAVTQRIYYNIWKENFLFRTVFPAVIVIGLKNHLKICKNKQEVKEGSLCLHYSSSSDCCSSRVPLTTKKPFKFCHWGMITAWRSESVAKFTNGLGCQVVLGAQASLNLREHGITVVKWRSKHSVSVWMTHLRLRQTTKNEEQNRNPEQGAHSAFFCSRVKRLNTCCLNSRDEGALIFQGAICKKEV